MIAVPPCIFGGPIRYHTLDAFPARSRQSYLMAILYIPVLCAWDHHAGEFKSFGCAAGTGCNQAKCCAAFSGGTRRCPTRAGDGRTKEAIRPSACRKGGWRFPGSRSRKREAHCSGPPQKGKIAHGQKSLPRGI